MASRKKMEGLIDSRPVIRAYSPDEMAEGLERIYRVKGFDCRGGEEPFFAAANRAVLSGSRLHYCRYDSAVTIEFGAMEGMRQFFCLSGGGMARVGAAEMPISKAGCGIIPDNNGFCARYEGGYAHLVLEVDTAVIQRKFERLYATDRRIERVLPSLRPLKGPGFQRLRSVALGLAQQFAGPEESSALVIAELEEALVTSFVVENQATAHDLPASRMAGDHDVRRLEDYIRGNWHKPLTVDDIAAACGISVRSVFAAFRDRRGTSPNVFLRQVRLEEARRQLACGEAPTVIDVALRCGFASFGHFARRYKEAFGELPSETLHRSGQR